MLRYCEAHYIDAFIPWGRSQGGLASDGPLAEAARGHGVWVGVVALAWLLARSRCMLPIPGTSRVAHLEDNMQATQVKLIGEELAAIETATA